MLPSKKNWDRKWKPLEEFLNREVFSMKILVEFECKRHFGVDGNMDKLRIRTKNFDFEHTYKYNTKYPDDYISPAYQDLLQILKMRKRDKIIDKILKK